MFTSILVSIVRIACAVVLSAAAGCATQSSPATAETPFAELGEQFVHRVPFEIGETHIVGDDRIEILEVWGTRPSIEPGGDYIVVGTFHLASSDAGTVDLGLTQSGEGVTWLTGADLATTSVHRGDGRFVLHCGMPWPGYFHVELNARGGEQPQRVVNTYFGDGESLLVAAASR